jgi:MarR-like DNA-binding transcriptional regulator SgrR of sgrS sRNA
MVTMGNWWTDIQTPDASTVTLVSDTPRPAAFEFLEYLNIIDPVTAQGPNAQTTLVGTGPFTFGEWSGGDHLTLNKNANYWRSGQPYLDQVVFRIGRDPQAVLAQLEGGTVDAMDSPPVNDATRLRQEAKYQVLTNPHPGGYTAVLVNTTQPPFDKKEVRQALGKPNSISPTTRVPRPSPASRRSTRRTCKVSASSRPCGHSRRRHGLRPLRRAPTTDSTLPRAASVRSSQRRSSCSAFTGSSRTTPNTLPATSTPS